MTSARAEGATARLDGVPATYRRSVITGPRVIVFEDIPLPQPRPRPVHPFEAALAEPLACVLHDVKRFTPRRGDTAVIVGAGIMGLLHLAALRSTGAVVVVSEPDSVRRAKALEMGAHAVIDPSTEDYVEAVKRMTDGRGASVTYMAIGVPGAI